AHPSAHDIQLPRGPARALHASPSSPPLIFDSFDFVVSARIISPRHRILHTRVTLAALDITRPHTATPDNQAQEHPPKRSAADTGWSGMRVRAPTSRSCIPCCDRTGFSSSRTLSHATTPARTSPPQSGYDQQNQPSRSLPLRPDANPSSDARFIKKHVLSRNASEPVVGPNE